MRRITGGRCREAGSPRRVPGRLALHLLATLVVSLVVVTPLGVRSASAATTSHAGHAAHPRQVREPDRSDRARDDDDGTAPAGVVDPKASQTIDGFGASGAWWPTDVADFTPAAQDELGRLLFSKDGLYLSQYRYNIGGGGVGVTVPYKAPPSFLQADGTYNWGADPDGMLFLEMADSYHVPQLIGFVNSAPPAFTTDQKSCGGELDPSKVADFAEYLATVVDHLESVDHIDISYISPMNEPDSAQATCHQEGMVVPVDLRAELVKDVAAYVATAPEPPGVIADESSLESQLLAEYPEWLPEAGTAVAVVAHHAYDYPDTDTLEKVAQIPVKHWATEICCFNGKGFGWQYDPTMVNGLWLADTIYDDLAVAHDSAFDWWVAASPNIGCDPSLQPGCQDDVNPHGRNDGLVYFDPDWSYDGNEAFYLTKRYWVMAAFSRYVRPGAVLHEVSDLPDGVKAMAFEDGSHWILEVVNDDSEAHDVAIRLPDPVDGSARGYTTDATHDLDSIDVDGTTDEPAFSAPADSLTTVLVDGTYGEHTHLRRDHSHLTGTRRASTD